MGSRDLSLAKNNVALPPILDDTLPHLKNVLDAFSLPRDIIVSDETIRYAWRDLPREIERIPPELRNAPIVRACLAVSVGLFDSAINQVWNATVTMLKRKINNFGLSAISEILGKNFDENKLENLRDYELLELCYKLQLLSEEGYLFLNQCREIRNNFSSAHPSIGQIDDRELITFISRCFKYGFTTDYATQGIDVQKFLTSLKNGALEKNQLKYWVESLSGTFSAQKQLLIPMLMGINCDPSSPEPTRINCLNICKGIKDTLDAKTKSTMLDRYNQYRIEGDTKRFDAARKFFEHLKLIGLLDELDVHSILQKACINLLEAHMGFDNFYHEPPLAERLSELLEKTATPKTIQQQYVYTVLTCYVGNRYGFSWEAEEYYEKMIIDFSPKEIMHMLELVDTEKLFSNKMEHPDCRQRYGKAIKLVKEASLDKPSIKKREGLLKKLGHVGEEA